MISHLLGMCNAGIIVENVLVDSVKPESDKKAALLNVQGTKLFCPVLPMPI